MQAAGVPEEPFRRGPGQVRSKNKTLALRAFAEDHERHFGAAQCWSPCPLGG
jgi:hypothetical protein